MQASIFNKAFNAITTTINFDESWYNGTGYLDHAVHAVKLQPNQRAVSTTTGGRKVIMVGTVYGTIVLFERFTDNDNEENIVVVNNCPRELNNIIECSSMSDNGFNDAINKDWDNPMFLMAKTVWE